MTASALGILAASLLGSVHCAAMCGGFVCFSTGSMTPRHGASALHGHALYHAGRLVSYLVLGAAAGALGGGITRLGTVAGVARGATIVAGALMVGWAISTIAAQRGIALPSPTIPERWPRMIGGLLVRLRHAPDGVRAAVTGIATTLLPCGWLYVFVAAAGGTGDLADAMLVMAIFWLGTVPALVAIGVGAQQLFGPLRERLPTIGALTVFAIGVLAIAGRLTMTMGASTHGH
jgi:sulfite exporter TauE/SafE